MQTFLPYSNFNESAKCLDRQRLGKQRVEAKQILQVNLFVQDKIDTFICDNCLQLVYEHTGNHNCQGWYNAPIEFREICYKEYREDYGLVHWENHPAVLMWRGYETALAQYGRDMCLEWGDRGYKDNLLNFFSENYYGHEFGYFEYPSWLEDERLHSSHRSALLYKNYEHYSQFGWKEQPNLDYYWPVRKGET